MTINRTALKSYAPEARQEFIAAVSARAAKFGITKKDPAPVEERGDVVLIGGHAYPKRVGAQRKKLLERIRLHGFDQTMEEVAYTWFNRFLAIRYMELHGYLDHGYRVLSHPSGKELPEILEHAEHLDFPALDKGKVIDLKLDGTKDAELYRMLLIAQCNALHRAMPFLFERIDDETELLLPDNLLHTDSLIRKLVTYIDETDWTEIEIIGWLYQFYISEKKDRVFDQLKKSKKIIQEDIPAATQLFTPNWIVKYMVQNSLGAQWLATYPDSPLKDQMDYYIETVEQSDEVQRQLDEITPKELSPEGLTLMDPACGSGHILVEAYDLFKAVYLERGYRLRDIPRLILKKNLYGLDIDDRAAQMAGFALLMKALADDPRLLSADSPPVINVMSLQDSKGLDAEDIARAILPKGSFELVPSNDLLPHTVSQPVLSAPVKSEADLSSVRKLISMYSEAKNFGSILEVPEDVLKFMPALSALVDRSNADDMLLAQAKQALVPLVRQTEILGRKYDAVVANPPYMGGRGMNGALARFVKEKFPDSKSDLFAVFIERGTAMLKPNGIMAMITMQSWMFLSSFEKLRNRILSCSTILGMVHLGERAFDTIGGAVVSTTAFTIKSFRSPKYLGNFVRAVDGRSEAEKRSLIHDSIQSPDCSWRFTSSSKQLEKIPGSPLAYWLSDKVYEIFACSRTLEEIEKPRQGATTSDNQRFLRFWHEVPFGQIGFGYLSRDEAASSGQKWFPYNKGGEFRRWYGNHDVIINYKNDGEEIKEFHEELNKTRPGGRLKNQEYYFRPSVSWSKISTGSFAVRYFPAGFIFDVAGSAIFFDNNVDRLFYGAFLNSNFTKNILRALSPTLNFEAEHLCRIPILDDDVVVDVAPTIVANAESVLEISKKDWDAYEISWGFESHPLLSEDKESSSIADNYAHLCERWQQTVDRMRHLEEENNKTIINAYGLQGEISTDVPLQEISLNCNAIYRYGGELDNSEYRRRLLSDTMAELLSFAMGCMMGRYSVSEPGLIYANAGNEGFDPSRYGDFSADDDGIVPITEIEWFDDDAVARFEQFLKVVWPPETLRENLRFVAESVATNGGDDPHRTIRNYFSKSFFKDHLKTYKKRPIYWLFSSGKLKAFECLVYLHRYNDSTLSRMRMEYVTPLQSRMSGRIDQLADDIEAAGSSAERNRLQKEKDKLDKQLEELRAFDEELRHFADQRIKLDLDDGVKVNYGKFGNLLAERKAITGEK